MAQELFIGVGVLVIPVYILHFKVTGFHAILGGFLGFIFLPDAQGPQAPLLIDSMAYKPLVINIILLFLADHIAFGIHYIHHVAVEVHDLVAVQGEVDGGIPGKVLAFEIMAGQV
jgi:hypothetical protein